MWRKTMSRNSGSSCLGTDPNRNWNFGWAGNVTDNHYQFKKKMEFYLNKRSVLKNVY